MYRRSKHTIGPIMSSGHLADVTGIPKRTAADYLSGRRKPPIDVILAWVRAFDGLDMLELVATLVERIEALEDTK